MPISPSGRLDNPKSGCDWQSGRARHRARRRRPLPFLGADPWQCRNLSHRLAVMRRGRYPRSFRVPAACRSPQRWPSERRLASCSLDRHHARLLRRSTTADALEAGWTSVPIPNGSGSNPTIAVDPDGQIYVAWQSRSPSTHRFEIFCAQNSQGAWSLPENISANDQSHAIYPSLAITVHGICHLAWQEDRGGIFCIRHADRYPNGWSENLVLTQSASRLSIAARVRQSTRLSPGGLGGGRGRDPPSSPT